MSQAGMTNVKGGGGGVVSTLTANDGTVVPPTANNINVFGASVVAGTTPVSTVGNAGTSTLTTNVQRSQAIASTDATKIGLAAFNSAQFTVDANGFVSSSQVDLHITPFIVSAAGITNGASYTTIQAALNAANSAGGGVVYIQPTATPYVENLTLFNGVHLYGTPAVSQNQGATVTISGTHTPPTSGQVAFNTICFISTTNVFNSAAVGSTHLAFLNCESAVENGYFLNLPNWTGTLEIFDNNPTTAGAPFAINDGGINNTGGSTILVFNAGLGSGTNIMNLSGPVFTEGASFACPVNFQTGSNINLQSHEFLSPVTFSNNTTGICYFCDFEGGTNPAITMSSSANISLFHGVINSTNNPAIAGSGVGILSYSNLIFPNNAIISGTLTLSTNSWRPYSQAIASTDGTKVGTCAFNSAQFSVDTNGFVSIIGGGFTWNDVSGAFSPLKENGYFVTGTATGTLPASPSQGDTIKFFVDHASQVLTIKAAGTQLIRLGSLVSSAGGTAVSTLQGDSVELVYRASDTQWCAIAGFSGTWTMA